MSELKKTTTNEKVLENTAVKPVVQSKKSHKRQLIGTVMSNKMLNTVTIRVINSELHSKYKKVVRKFRKYMAHNEVEGLNVGDKVKIVESRPLSKNVKWIVISKLDK